MSRLWADDGISCVHPGWPPLLGRETVIDSYREIMRNPARDRVEHGNDEAIVGNGEGRVLCIEVVGGTALAAANWFRLVGGTLRMIHHQASPIAGFVEAANVPSSSQRLN